MNPARTTAARTTGRPSHRLPGALPGSAAALVAAALLATAGAAPAPASAAARCRAKVYPRDPLYLTSARGLSCASALREQRRYAWNGVRVSFRTRGGYRCGPAGRGSIGFRIRCVKRSRSYTLEIAD